MYRYDEFDHAFVRDRVAQFRDQVARRLSGELTEEQFKPLRLMNGVYLQLHAYMLRIAIPYGTLSGRQMRKLAYIARTYDKGYGHFTTRQNLQFNWPRLEDLPDILAELAEVEMHAIQTSGNCIRNVTTDHFAGAAADEVDDPRPWAEIIRQWSSLHPEFSFLPRKFKVAVTGAARDRAAIRVHDIGLELRRGPGGGLGFRVFVGGGQGRTPMLAKEIRDFVPEQELLAYLEAIMRVYNRYGRRDNKYKARVKILVHERGLEEIREQVEAEFAELRGGALDVPVEAREAISAYFAPPSFEDLPRTSRILEEARLRDRDLALWVARNSHPHKQPGYVSVTISLKPIGGVPGDATADQMDKVAELAERFSFDEIRVSHEQNLILPHVRKDDLPALHAELKAVGLATPNAGFITDIIACPGLDYCALANARSIPVAQRLSERFADTRRQSEIGDLAIKISGCINACGHHHVGHIGILGVDRKGEEFYQITLGGAPGGENGGEDAAIGEIVGKGFSTDEVVDAVETIVDTYLKLRETPQESFLAAYRRLGKKPFQEALYGR
ncbi:sulfite reductase (NADPH) hemoprotein beta-component [Tepidamorphus gemmatus]|uniref:Sulfite reductase (NADPH) hemoprotein beta-component n=1 Tax=Tepidamorphus gemmatus TaxID=747076 RepID=A0A4R3M068_9HYPH|nr:nitrite/sulfite reductase [Tepidamorphus gemmatus]TCT06444.1 sulfite reductase (NADPH) hemoprotein beta-component [Tepidamorphus gemmatus]